MRLKQKKTEVDLCLVRYEYIHDLGKCINGLLVVEDVHIFLVFHSLSFCSWREVRVLGASVTSLLKKIKGKH